MFSVVTLGLVLPVILGVFISIVKDEVWYNSEWLTTALMAILFGAIYILAALLANIGLTAITAGDWELEESFAIESVNISQIGKNSLIIVDENGQESKVSFEDIRIGSEDGELDGAEREAFEAGDIIVRKWVKKSPYTIFTQQKTELVVSQNTNTFWSDVARKSRGDDE